jgi:hypothetical protein
LIAKWEARKIAKIGVFAWFSWNGEFRKAESKAESAWNYPNFFG